jgi:hypothetical protein
MPPKVEAFTRCTHIQKTDTQRVLSEVAKLLILLIAAFRVQGRHAVTSIV